MNEDPEEEEVASGFLADLTERIGGAALIFWVLWLPMAFLLRLSTDGGLVARVDEVPGIIAWSILCLLAAAAHGTADLPPVEEPSTDPADDPWRQG